jgi:hypothetical protein
MYCNDTQLTVDEGGPLSVSSKSVCYGSYQSAAFQYQIFNYSGPSNFERFDVRTT